MELVFREENSVAMGGVIARESSMEFRLGTAARKRGTGVLKRRLRVRSEVQPPWPTFAPKRSGWLPRRRCAHNLLLIGPPGAGKSLLARCLPELLPPLSFPEALEVTRIYSIAGLIERGRSLVVRRPFRAPHQTISYAGMVGGGHGVPGPREISLAHHGVLGKCPTSC